jgi:hypothetical protein
MADKNSLSERLAQDYHDAQQRTGQAMQGSCDPKELSRAQRAEDKAYWRADRWNCGRAY